MKLPPLNDDKKKSKKEKAENSLKLPDIDRIHINENRERFKEHFKEIVNRGDKSKIDDKDNNASIKKTYEDMMGLFSKEEVSSDDLLVVYEKEIKEKNLYSLDSLEKAIDSGDFDLRDYDIFTINKILIRLEKAKPPVSLESYNIKTIEDFYEEVASGKIEIDKYPEKEIDDFIDKLMK